MLPARRVIGSLTTSGVTFVLALGVASVFGAVRWVATLIASLVIFVWMLLRGRR